MPTRRRQEPRTHRGSGAPKAMGRSGLLAERELDVAVLVHASVQHHVVQELGGRAVDVHGRAVLLDDLVGRCRCARRPNWGVRAEQVPPR